MIGFLATASDAVAKALSHITPGMWKIIGYVVAVMLIFWIGYGVGARNVRDRIESARVEALTEALTQERERATREAALATELAAKLQKSEAERVNNVREVIREIPIMVPDNRACDLPADLLRRLNEVGQ